MLFFQLQLTCTAIRLPRTVIRILGDRIKKIHVKDFSAFIGNINRFRPLLSGDVNWKNVFIALEEIGYEDTITSELSPYAIDPSSRAVDTLHHMDILFGSSR